MAARAEAGAPAGATTGGSAESSTKSSAPAARVQAGATVSSRFGEISALPGLGASVDIGLGLGARNAQARAFAAGERRPRGARRGSPLPYEIPTARALPTSRVNAAVTTTSRR